MRNENFYRRKRRVRSKIFGTKSKPRLSIFRSNKNIYVQIVNDEEKKTLVGLSSAKLIIPKGKSMNKFEKGLLLGKEIAEKALKSKIKEVVFDRSGYKYHGRVEAVAKGAREGGLKF